jgi:predicted pyridoxine 5'-phosphate oxidase superfamily flavin-nucleotide-binding protein
MRLSTVRGSQSSRLAAVLAVSFLNGLTPAWCDNAVHDCLIGFTAFRTNLPGGRLANEATMRASVIQADGTHRREIAAELADGPNAWTQFAGWSPDGKMAIVLRGW